MKISRERLLRESESTGFRPEVLEKVMHLLSLLTGFSRHPFLQERVALKGGTALNLFVLDLPRLSVDIDLNYVGATDVATMQAERPWVEEALAAVCSREGLTVARPPGDEHAGGRFSLRYESALGGGANLKLDVNYMFRQSLWPIQRMDSHALGATQARPSASDNSEVPSGPASLGFCRLRWVESEELADCDGCRGWIQSERTPK